MEGICAIMPQILGIINCSVIHEEELVDQWEELINKKRKLEHIYIYISGELYL